MDVVTVSSEWELVTYVSEYIVRMSQEKAREVSTPRAAPGSPPLHEAPSVSSSVLVEVRARGLTCTIRGPRDASGVALVTFRQTLSPDIEDEYRALASQLPALDPPLRGSYATKVEWRADCGAYSRTWHAWMKDHPDDGWEAYYRACDRRRELEEARQQPRKAFTMAVGLTGRAQRVSKKVMKGIREAETWRFNPEKCSLLEELRTDDRPIARLKAQGKFEQAAKMEADTRRLIAQLGRQPAEVQQRQRDRWPRAMKPLWYEPVVTTQEDMQFELVLRLCQERMSAYAPEIASFLDWYMKQFKYAFTEDERHWLRQGYDLGGGEGFAALLRTDSDPESARGRRHFIAKTLAGRACTAARKEAEQSGQWLVTRPRTDGLYSAYTAVSILAKEASEGQWTPPSRDWLDDQMNKGILPFVRDARGHKCLDEHGLQRVRELVQDERARRALVEYQLRKLGKSRRAANKWVQEHRDRGESYTDMTNLFLRRARKEAKEA